ncbi:MAG: GntR family transcriptional regulator [Desulfobacterales bacterium]|nr:GntR family transcriptional regulator [Desulfobacterales bacterium]
MTRVVASDEEKTRYRADRYDTAQGIQSPPAQILSAEYAPKERLFEAKISDEIGASRTPVREALHSLELEGLIECLPKVGYVVKSISDREVAEICEIRGLIEGLAAPVGRRESPGKTD